MIKFDLACTAGHEFEAWFKSGATFDAQAQAHQLACPTCGSTGIAKRPMAPAIQSGRSKPTADDLADRNAGESSAQVIAAEFRDALKAFRSDIVAHTENVGERFAEEARSMHYGETPKRPIRGAATAEEASELLDEGVEFGVLPPLPEDKN